MPFSNELGMRVYDPTEGENYGLRQGQMFANAYENAQRRAMDERRLKMLEQEQQMKASQLLMQGQGMAELREEVEKGTPFQDAFFKAAPKLFMHNPQALGQIMETKAKNDATKAYQQSLLQQRAKAEQDLNEFRMKPKQSQSEMEAEGIATHEKRLGEVTDALQKVTGWTAPQKAELERQKKAEESIVGTMQARHPAKETFASKIDKLSSIQVAYDAAEASGDPDLMAKAKADLQAAQALLPANRQFGSEEIREPVVKEVNGVKYAYVPGSKQIHIIKNEDTKAAFRNKTLPAMLRGGMDYKQAVETVDKAWEAMNPEPPPAKPTTGTKRLRWNGKGFEPATTP